MSDYVFWGDFGTGGKTVRPPRLRCTWCGRFVSYKDLRTGECSHFMVTPDSDCSFEEWETNCKRCNEEKCDDR